MVRSNSGFYAARELLSSILLDQYVVAQPGCVDNINDEMRLLFPFSCSLLVIFFRYFGRIYWLQNAVVVDEIKMNRIIRISITGEYTMDILALRLLLSVHSSPSLVIKLTN